MAEDKEKWIPPVARDWEDAKTNKEYWWNCPKCKDKYCDEKALSFRDRCWEHLSDREREGFRQEILSSHKMGESLRGLNLMRVNLERADLIEARLEGALLIQTSLNGAFLWEARLEGARLREASLKGAKLREARLEMANLIDAKLEGAHLSEAKLGGALLTNAKMEGANLWSARVEGAVLLCARLEGADLYKANLKGTDLSGVSVGQLGYTQSETVIDKRKKENSDEEQLVLQETDIKPKGRTTDFIDVEYNPHTRIFLYPFAIIGYGIKNILRKIRREEPPEKPLYASFKKTIFLGIDTTRLDHSKNPTLARDINYQQFLADFRERRPRWLYRIAFTIWGLTSFFGESLAVWLCWATIIVVGFALAFGGYLSFLECNIHINGEPISGFVDALYLSGLVFTSLGLGQFTPQHTLAKMLVLAEVMVGFIMLGSLVSFFANKFVRRD